MLIKEHKSNHLTLGCAQFAIAIALDSLNCFKAVRPVLSYLGTNTAKDVEKHKRILQDRAALNKELENSGMDAIMFLLKYFEENEVLFVVKYQSGAERFTGPYRLSKLCGANLTSEIYAKACKIFFSTPSHKLIVKYMKTNAFKVEFFNFVRKRVGGSTTGINSNICSSTLIKVLDLFTEFVDTSCSGEGKYAPESGTPENYLFRAKDAQGPFDWFCMSHKGEQSAFYTTLNEIGLESTLVSGDGEGSMSIIDNFSIDQSSTEYDIDFVGVCERIYKASNMLFSHSNEPILRYDIFTHHRAKMLEPTIQSFRKIQDSFLAGVHITFTDQDADAFEMGDTFSNKLRARVKICDVFEKVITDGIRKVDIYNDLYETRILNATLSGIGNTAVIKDGKALFSMGRFNLGHSYSDGELLNTILDGYLALKDLVLYLGSSSNTTGITVNNFPVTIFRDPSRVRRFKSLDEYIHFNSEVEILCNEVASSPIRMRSSLNGILSNDSTYDLLASSRGSKTDAIVQKLKDTKIGFILEAVQKRSIATGASLDRVLEGQFTRIRGFMSDCFKNPVRKNLEAYEKCYATGGLPMVESFIYNLGNVVIQLRLLPETDKNAAKQNTYNYALASQYVQLLIRTMAMEEVFVDEDNHELGMIKHRVIDDNGIYLLKKSSLIPELSLENKDVIDRIGVQGIQALLTTRYHALLNCMNLFWSKNYNLDSFNVDPSWEEVRLLFYTSYLAFTFFSTVSEYIEDLAVCQKYAGGYDVQLMFAKAAGNEKFLNLKKNIATAQDLVTFLKEKDFLSFMPASYSAGEAASPAEDIKKLITLMSNTERDVVHALRYMFENMSDIFDFVKVINERVNDFYGDVTSSVVVDSQTEESLRKAVDTILGLHESKEIVRIQMCLESRFEFDAMGYVVLNNSRYAYISDSNRYVFLHRSGHKVIYNKSLNIFDIDDLTEDEINDVLTSSQF